MSPPTPIPLKHQLYSYFEVSLFLETNIIEFILETNDPFCYLFCCTIEIKSITTKKLKKICGKDKTTLGIG